MRPAREGGTRAGAAGSKWRPEGARSPEKAPGCYFCDDRGRPGKRDARSQVTAGAPLTLMLPAAGARQSYWVASRAPRYSLTFALPLLLVYEALAALLARPDGSGLRNGADVILRSLAAAAGRYGPMMMGAAVIGLSLWLIGRDVRRHGWMLRPSFFARMLGESALLAVLVGVVVGVATRELLQLLPVVLVQAPLERVGWPTQLMLSLGAGLYEELLFRVLLVSALALGARTLLGLSVRAAGATAALGGALLFSAFHYVGAYGDPFTLQSFVFRALAGLFFSVLYLLRGFGITAWTHALYDVMVLLIVR